MGNPVLYSTFCESSNSPGTYTNSTRLYSTNNKVTGKEETHHLMHLRKHLPMNRDYSSDQEKNHTRIWNTEKIKLMLNSHCISWTVHSELHDPDNLLLLASESLSKVTKLRTHAIVAAVEMELSPITRKNTIWEISLENNKVHVNKVLMGVV